MNLTQRMGRSMSEDPKESAAIKTSGLQLMKGLQTLPQPKLSSFKDSKSKPLWPEDPYFNN